MRILHYGLGYPPIRSGGLVGYSIDLMKEQVEQGDQVYYLYPGKINIFTKHSYIVFDKKNSSRSFQSYELINSLPLPLVGGIKNPNDFMKNADKEIYYNLFKNINPEVIHIHTLMGLHKEFLEVAKDMVIKIVYTTHDYFGLSPNPTFFFEGKSWDNENSLDFWVNVGNKDSLSTGKLRFFQMSIYPKVRRMLKYIKNGSEENKKAHTYKPVEKVNNNVVISYKKLIEYYQLIFSYIDIFHFNSTVSKQVYENNLNNSPNKSTVISITNSSISEKKKSIRKKILRILHI